MSLFSLAIVFSHGNCCHNLGRQSLETVMNKTFLPVCNRLANEIKLDSHYEACFDRLITQVTGYE